MIISGKTADLETKLGATCVQLSLVCFCFSAKGWVRQKGWALSSEFWALDFVSVSVQCQLARPAALEAIKQGRLGIKNESQGQGFATHKGSHTHTLFNSRIKGAQWAHCQFCGQMSEAICSRFLSSTMLEWECVCVPVTVRSFTVYESWP